MARTCCKLKTSSPASPAPVRSPFARARLAHAWARVVEKLEVYVEYEKLPESLETLFEDWPAVSRRRPGRLSLTSPCETREPFPEPTAPSPPAHHPITSQALGIYEEYEGEIADSDSDEARTSRLSELFANLFTRWLTLPCRPLACFVLHT